MPERHELPVIVLDVGYGHRQCTMAVNLRVGEALVLTTRDGVQIEFEMKAKHGNGGRFQVKAPRSVSISQR